MKCEEALCESLSVDNAVNAWSLGELHSATQLKSQAVEFISNHADQVKETPGWKNMLRQSPGVALVADVAKQQVRTFVQFMDGIEWLLVAENFAYVEPLSLESK